MILRHKLKVLVPLIALVAALGFVAGCGDDDSASSTSGTAASGGGSELTIVGYSVAREVNADLIKAFQATPAGEGVTFKESYAASGEQSRAVEAGLKADYVVFSLEPDMTRLVDAGLVDPDWNAGPNKGMVSDSVVVFITRKGNPKGITTWDDLTKDGVQVITPNPFTSGAAQWNIIAAYQSQIDQGKTHDQALQYIDALFKNVPVQPASGREALQVFDSGQGDVLLSYENEAIAAQAAGEDIDYTVPDQNLLIENPAAVVNTGNVAKAHGLPGLRELRRRPEDLRGARVPAGRQGRREGVQLPAAGATLDDRRPGRLEEGEERVLRSGERHHHQDLPGSGNCH